MKKILALLLAATMLLTSLVLVGCGDDNKEDLGPADDLTVDYTVKQGEDVFTYAILTTDTVAIVGFVGQHDPHAVTVPSTVGDRKVVRIEAKTFYYQSCITSVTLPDTVVSIGTYAFAGCDNLTTVKFSSALETIEEAAFANSGLTTLSFNNTKVSTIGKSAFQNCDALTSVTFPSTLKELGDGAFFECTALTSVLIPEGTLSIGSACFCGCEALASVTVPASVETIGEIAFNRTPSLEASGINCPAGSVAADFFADDTKWY